MASHSSTLLSLTSFFFFLITIHAQTTKAPAPAPSGPINITAILDKPGQYTTFIRLLTETQVANQINNQVNSSTEGLTVLAPTDNAFQNLPPGALNKLSDQQQVQLVLYHVLPKYYTLESLTTVSNPVRTQASGQDGQVFGLNFTGSANQLNVSSGLVDTQIYNTIRKDFPLAMYQVDKVLLPDFSVTKAPSPGKSPASSSPDKKKTDDDSEADSSTAKSPSADSNGSGKMNVGLGMGIVSGFLLICMEMIS